MRQRKPLPSLVCSDCPAVMKKGEPGGETTYGCCPACRRKRGGQAARRSREIHHQGFGSRARLRKV